MNSNRNRDNELGRLILKLANTIIKNRNAHLAALDLTTAQADSLQFFLDNSGSTITDLKSYLGISRQTARGIVSRMIRKELLTGAPSNTDACCTIIAPTESGVRLGQQIRRNRERTAEKLLNGMADEESTIFIDLLSRPLKNAEND